MAEGFARAYGRDIVIPASAGLAPAALVAPLTIKVMLEKNIDLSDNFPKPLDFVQAIPFDLIVNMSGRKLPGKIEIPVEDWQIRDPIGEKEEVFRDVAQEIEGRVMRLLIAIRNQSGQARPAGMSNGETAPAPREPRRRLFGRPR